LVLKLLVLVAAAAATAYLTAIQVNLVKGSTGLEVAAIAILGVIAIGVSGRASFQAATRSRWDKKDIQVRESLLAVLLSCSKETKQEIELFTVAVWLITPRFGPMRFRQLRRARHRSVSLRHEGPSNVKWTIGKGVMGACWQDESPKFKDLTQLTNKYGQIGNTEWNALGGTVTMGLSYEDWKATKRKYRAVAAVPVRDDEQELVGCLVLNVAYEAEDVSAFETKLLQSMRAAAKVLGDVVY